MEYICDEQFKTTKTSFRNGFHAQRLADGRSPFSDGTEKEDALVARSESFPPFQAVN